VRICGIISEYNPFHKGHEAHISLTRAKTKADLIVCVMSGNFVQRGEPAIFDKWVRTVCALRCGADAVIELPILYSTQSAEGFAKGGIALLGAAGADTISFGCETDDIQALIRIAKKLSYETKEYKDLLKTHLDDGLSFPKARMMAAFPEERDELSMPNAILGIEYIKAIIRSGSDITPVAIKRVGQGYHSTDIETSLASATAIRRALAQGDVHKALNAMPDACSQYISRVLADGLMPVAADCFEKELIFLLRSRGKEYIKFLPDVSEGLENRIYGAALECSAREELISRIKTKRYTYTRISRILLYGLLGITADIIKKRNARRIDHIRILGVKNEDVLKALSRKCRVPLVTGSAASSRYDAIDVKASNAYALSQKAIPYCLTERDFTEKLIIVDK
jgi:predicted nucleotidyltransferase